MKLIYITGSHSSGKSSLLQSLKDTPNIIVFPRQHRKELFNEKEFKLFAKKEIVKVTVFKNLSERLETSVCETKKQFQLTKKKSNSFIVADHFLPDCMAYITTCFELGWLNKNEFDILRKRFKKEFLNNVNFGYSVFLIKPSFRKVQENFASDSLNNSRFWEQKTNFLKIAYRMFAKIYTEYSPNNINEWQIIRSNKFEEQKSFILKKTYQ
ncbi:MAG TPA: hypothetical protein ENI76_03725 [Ignavibacteria bacterium]|nr:hypothetical protein [Ignavibacteria bacterium]